MWDENKTKYTFQLNTSSDIVLDSVKKMGIFNVNLVNKVVFYPGVPDVYELCTDYGNFNGKLMYTDDNLTNMECIGHIVNFCMSSNIMDYRRINYWDRFIIGMYTIEYSKEHEIVWVCGPRINRNWRWMTARQKEQYFDNILNKNNIPRTAIKAKLNNLKWVMEYGK